MGERGPAPKRSDQRRRTNTPAAGEPTKTEDTFTVDPPPADDDWHPVAKLWFDSLARSGQSAFYANSDWGAAYVLAESISRELKPQPMIVGKGDNVQIEFVSQPPKGASLAAWLKGMSDLLVTEGARRRAAVELQRPVPSGTEQKPAGVTSMASWRAGLGA